MTQRAGWGGLGGGSLEVQPEKRRWEVSDCPVLKGTVKRRTLLQKLVGWSGGLLSGAGAYVHECLCVCVCESLFVFVSMCV